MKNFLLNLYILLLPGCAFQASIMKTGEKLVQFEAFGKASLSKNADGSIQMTSDHEKAVDPTAKAINVANSLTFGSNLVNKTPSVVKAFKK